MIRRRLLCTTVSGMDQQKTNTGVRKLRFIPFGHSSLFVKIRFIQLPLRGQVVIFLSFYQSSSVFGHLRIYWSQQMFTKLVGWTVFPLDLPFPHWCIQGVYYKINEFTKNLGYRYSINRWVKLYLHLIRWRHPFPKWLRLDDL